MVNTGGGMAGGDRALFAFACDAGAAATLTAAAAEKVYRADGDATRVAVRLGAAGGGALEWLPQETILFDGARLDRRFEVDLAADAAFLSVETLVFGRLAMGESVRRGALRDRWRVRRGGTLVFTDDVRIEGDMAATLDRPALGAGARAAATILLVSPDAETRLDGVRERLHAGPPEAAGMTAGASAWNGMLLVRALSPSPERLRGVIVSVVAALRGRAPPRSWQT